MFIPINASTGMWPFGNSLEIDVSNQGKDSNKTQALASNCL